MDSLGMLKLHLAYVLFVLSKIEKDLERDYNLSYNFLGMGVDRVSTIELKRYFDW